MRRYRYGRRPDNTIELKLYLSRYLISDAKKIARNNLNASEVSTDDHYEANGTHILESGYGRMLSSGIRTKIRNYLRSIDMDGIYACLPLLHWRLLVDDLPLLLFFHRASLVIHPLSKKAFDGQLLCSSPADTTSPCAVNIEHVKNTVSGFLKMER